MKSLWNKMIPISIRGAADDAEVFKEYTKKEKIPIQHVNFSNETLNDLLDRSSKESKPLLILVYQKSPNEEVNKLVTKLLQDKNFFEYINTKFIILGVLDKSETAAQYLNEVPSRNYPCFIVLKKNHLEKQIVLGFEPIQVSKSDPQAYI